MARIVENVYIAPLQGKTRAQQIARLKEWKKFWLSTGAEKVTVHEVGPGNIEAAWLFAIHHKSGAAYGTGIDEYYKNTKAYDAINEKWQKTPVFDIKTYAVTFEIDEI
jgi:hypothetical protein